VPLVSDGMSKLINPESLVKLLLYFAGHVAVYC